jgi:hypothetical protein
MKEISLHILDIAQNSIVANATRISINIEEVPHLDTLRVCISDNGKGISPEMLEKVFDPYTTSRTTRRVGLGLPLLNDACKCTGGQLNIESIEGVGTQVVATFGLTHIDRQPLGDIAGVLVLLIAANPNINFIYSHSKNGNEFKIDTLEVQEVLDGIPLSDPNVGRMLKEMISLNLDEL